MAKIIGIDLGTTYSAVSIWDDKRQIPIIIPNLRGSPTTPSVVSLNENGEVIVGEDAKQNSVVAPENTISRIKREMGQDFEVKLGKETYNPQTISAFILRYLKMSAEKYLNEPVYDAVITVPAYFTEVQNSATRDAGMIAGLNVHRLIAEPTAAAIAYGVKSQMKEGERKIYAVYDLGGGTFDVSIIDITSNEIAVVGTGGDSRLGGLDMDEEVMKWAVRQIKSKYNVDLSGDESAKQRLRIEAEDIKKVLVAAETATLNVPYLTMIQNRPLNVNLSITRPQFEMLILKLLQRSLDCMDVAMKSAMEKNQIGWEDLDGVLLVGGPTRLQKIRDMLKEKLKQEVPDKDIPVLSDLHPDEVVAMGAAIVAASLPPIGRPPEEVEQMKPEEVVKAQEAQGASSEAAPTIDIYDVTGHSLGIAVEGVKFHCIIPKETTIPITMKAGPFSNMGDYTTELLFEMYQGENEFVIANTKIGEVRVTGLDPMPKGSQSFEVCFSLDNSGTLSTTCTDLRTRKTYEGTFKFDGITRMSGEEIREKRSKVAAMMAGGGVSAGQSKPGGDPPPAQAGSTTAEPPVGLPQISLEQIPSDQRVYWKECLDCLSKLPDDKKPVLLKAMHEFAQAVQSGDKTMIEECGYVLQDTLFEVR